MVEGALQLARPYGFKDETDGAEEQRHEYEDVKQLHPEAAHVPETKGGLGPPLDCFHGIFGIDSRCRIRRSDTGFDTAHFAGFFATGGTTAHDAEFESEV